MFHTYAADGIYSAMLRARDDHDPPATSNPAQVQLKVGNEATTPRITAPSTSLLFRVGQELTLTDNATDPEDGAMANDQLSWEVIRHHNNSHTHPSLKPTTGNNMKIAPARGPLRDRQRQLPGDTAHRHRLERDLAHDLPEAKPLLGGCDL